MRPTPVRDNFAFCVGAIGHTGDLRCVSKKTESNAFLVVVSVDVVCNPPQARLVMVSSEAEARTLSTKVQQWTMPTPYVVDATLGAPITTTYRSLRFMLPNPYNLAVLPTANAAAATPNADVTGTMPADCVGNDGAANTSWPYNRLWHKVVISSTGRPTKKANRSRMAPDAQMTMVCAMIRAVPSTTHAKLAKTATRPPGDTNMYLLYDLPMCECGPQDGNAHLQRVTVVMSAYQIVALDPMEVTLAHRAVGKTRRERERALRNQQEKPTLDAFKHYLKALPFDASHCSMNWVVNAMDLENEERHRTYSSKDYGEEWATSASFLVDDEGHERTMTHQELMALNAKAHSYAASERRAYKKVMKQKHLYLTDDNATMRIAAHFDRDGIAQMMPALETGIKNMVMEQSAKLDLKGLPRLHDSLITDSIRRNLLLIVDTDPQVLRTDADIMSEVWSGDKHTVQRLQDRTKAYREARGLPSLLHLHNVWPADLRSAARTGSLRLCDAYGEFNGQSVPVPMRHKPWQAKVLVVDYALTSGGASDALRIATEEHCDVRSKTAPNLLNITMNTWALAVAAEHVLRSGSEFFTAFTGAVYSDVQRDPKTYVMRRLDEDWDDTVGDAMATSEAEVVDQRLSSSGIDLFIDTVQDVPPHSRFHGVVPFSEWATTFVDTLNMAEDDNEDITVHVMLVKSENTGHLFLCAWQVSKERNLELLKAQAEEELNDDNADDDENEDDTIDAD